MSVSFHDQFDQHCACAALSASLTCDQFDEHGACAAISLSPTLVKSLPDTGRGNSDASYDCISPKSLHDHRCWCKLPVSFTRTEKGASKSTTFPWENTKNIFLLSNVYLICRITEILKNVFQQPSRCEDTEMKMNKIFDVTWFSKYRYIYIYIYIFSELCRFVNTLW